MAKQKENFYFLIFFLFFFFSNYSDCFEATLAIRRFVRPTTEIYFLLIAHRYDGVSATTL